jgi:hypothetical protein
MDDQQFQTDFFSSFELDDEGRQLLELCDEISNARNVVAGIIAEIESITLHQNPSIETEWQVKVGVWENRLLEAQIAMRRAKRKLALAQACANRGESIDDELIESQLDTEFTEWKEQLSAAVGAYQQAVVAHMHTVHIDPTKAGQLKRLFRILAKRLHPDIRPSDDEAAQMMFFLAKAAYKQGDVEMLESLEVSTRRMDADEKMPQTVDEAEAELALLMAQAGVLEKRKQDLMAEKPFCLKKLLKDEAWLANHIGKLQDEIAECEKAETLYRDRQLDLTGQDG